MSACNTHPVNRIPHLVIVTNGDDWEAVYRDGILANEGHSTDGSTLAWMTNSQPFTLQYLGEQQNFADHAEETGHAPQLLADAVDDLDVTS